MMQKPYNIILILILLANVIMGMVLFQQSAQLTEYARIISSLEVRMEDLDDAIEVDVLPRLKEILNEK
jgi:regulatory protein YycI of two-component signal transduction system YycFG